MNIATNKPVRIAGIIGIVLGALFVVVGGAAWVFTSSQLSAQNITVPGSANFLAGSRVNNPFSALAQADTIGMHAEAAITGMLEEAGLPTDDTTFAGLGAIQRAHEAGTAERTTPRPPPAPCRSRPPTCRRTSSPRSWPLVSRSSPSASAWPSPSSAGPSPV